MTMHTHIAASLAGLLFSINIYATETQLQIDEVVVTANRINERASDSLRDISVITRDDIDLAGSASLVELLQTQPGIEISSNGGPGKISSVFMRGTNSNHVVVLIDGIRVNSATLGTTAFENLPLAQIDRIEIVRGPASSQYGADAIGGVIQIFTRKGGGSPSFRASAGYGSYDTKTADAGVSGSVGDTSYAFNVSSYDTRGYSALKTRDPRFRDNDGYHNLALSGNLSHRINDNHEVGIQLFRSEGGARFDSRFNATNFSDRTKLTQQTVAITSRNQFTSRWLSTLKLGSGMDESESFQEFGRSLFETKQEQFSWQNDIRLPVGTLTLLYDRLEERVDSTTSFDRDTRSNDGYLASYLVNLDRHSLQASYRVDKSSQYDTHQTGGLGYGYSITPEWRATANYGTAFKAPSFNDLFFPGFSNPNLKPEQSRNIEAALRYDTATRNASLTVYENRIRDLIALDFTSAPFIFNVNEARIQGLTLAGTQRWDNWRFNASIDIQSPRDEDTDKLLVRRANRHANFSALQQVGNWRWGTEVLASSERYNDAANTQRLAGYATLNLLADYKLNQDWTVLARLNNVLDKDYALSFDGNPATGGFIYNTAGTNVFVSLRWQPAQR